MISQKQDIQEYAVGQQDFKKLRQSNSVYIDKTKYIEIFLRRNMQYLFLARPRRFGKSLFLSTLRYFFEGERELFKGLLIDSYDWDWAHYPVLHFDLNSDRFSQPAELDRVLDQLFRRWEEKYRVDVKDEGYSQRFRTIIETAHKNTGLPVVILVDEYDKPLVSNLNHSEQFDYFRNRLASIYSNFKSAAEHIRFVFLTGVSRFGKLSVFSDINNIKDISFSDEFADICGITKEELYTNFRPGIQKFADKEEISFEEACAELKVNYDGYRFSRFGSDIYNTWSVLNAMQDAAISNYWAATGKPTIVVEALHDRNVDLEKILNTDCPIDQLRGLDLSNLEPLPLLYQTGYLTIKDYDRDTQLYRLGIPNREVSRDLFHSLLPYYVSVDKNTPVSVAENIINALLQGKPEEMIENLDIFLAGIPYEMKMENENNFHNAVYILLSLIGARTQTEVHISNGRIDLLIKTKKYIYLIELKFGKDSIAAVDQIVEKHYDRPFHNDPRTIFRIGVNFNPITLRLDPPLIMRQ